METNHNPHPQRVTSAGSSPSHRASSVYFFCPDAENSMAQGLDSPSYQSGKTEQNLALDLEILCAFLGSQNDTLLMRRLPSPAHRLRLLEAGFSLPECEALSSEGTLAPERLTTTKGEVDQLCPWAWCPASAALLAPLRKSLPGSSAVFTPAWNGSLRTLFSKENDLRLARQLLDRISCPDLEAEVIGHAVTSTEALHRTIGDFQKQGFSELMVKAPFGSSGQANHRWQSGRILPWCQRTLAQQGCLVVEPLLERILDFSAHYQRTRCGTRFLGFVLLENNARGQFRAVQTGPEGSQGLSSPLAQFLATTATPLFQTVLPSFLDEVLQPAGYFGPVGIDSFLYRNRAGEWKLKPVVELNPRFTMGRVIWEIQQRAAPSQVARLELHRHRPERPSTFRLDPGTGTLIQADMLLNEPVSATPCYARLLVESSPAPPGEKPGHRQLFNFS